MINRTNQQWRKLVEEWKSSGLSQMQWCNKSNINYNTFKDRIARINKQDLAMGTEKDKQKLSSEGKSAPSVNGAAPHVSNKQASEFVKVEIKKNKDGTKNQLRKTTNSSSVFIEVGSFRIKVDNGFDENTFVKVCRGLLSIC